MFKLSPRTIVPRLNGVRFVSTTVQRVATPAASSPANASNNAKASITTTATSPSNPAPTASAYVTGMDGRLKSANRSFHANTSESTSGLNDSSSAMDDRLNAKLQRMHDAKELAGLYN